MAASLQAIPPLDDLETRGSAATLAGPSLSTPPPTLGGPGQLLSHGGVQLARPQHSCLPYTLKCFPLLSSVPSPL